MRLPCGSKLTWCCWESQRIKNIVLDNVRKFFEGRWKELDDLATRSLIRPTVPTSLNQPKHNLSKRKCANDEGADSQPAGPPLNQLKRAEHLIDANAIGMACQTIVSKVEVMTVASCRHQPGLWDLVISKLKDLRVN